MNNHQRNWLQLQGWLKEDALRMAALEQAATLSLPQWCLGAGFVRNLVWDRLHGYSTPTPLNDIDLVYFDATDCEPARDAELEQQLARQSDLPFSVKNQARMHLRSGRAPFSSCEDALSYWVEVETAVAVGLNDDGCFRLIAPLGLEALFALQLTHNPRHGNTAEFQQRVEGKDWLRRWPRLKLI